MTTPPKSISGLTDAAAARVVLFQSREFVTVPGNAMGLQATIPATGLLPSSIGGTGMHLEVVGGVPAWVEPAEKFVAAGTFGAAATKDIDLTTWVAQGFRRYKVMWSDTAFTNSSLLHLRFSNNGGSSFVATGYASDLIFGHTASGASASNLAAGTTAVQLIMTAPSGSGSSWTSGFAEVIFTPNVAEWFSIAKSISATGPSHGMLMSGGHVSLTNGNAIRFLTSAGTMTGTWAIHALKDF